MPTLQEVLDKYRAHPQFLGIELTSANQRGAVDDTPLHIAARRGDVDDIAVLVAHGADVNAPGDLGNTPLHCAALTGQLKAAMTLVELGADLAIENEFQEKPVLVAEQGNHRDVFDFLKRRTKKK